MPKQRVIELATLNVNGDGQEQLEDFSLNGQLYRFDGVTFKQIGQRMVRCIHRSKWLSRITLTSEVGCDISLRAIRIYRWRVA
jgi:hypothetical protein